MKDIDWDSVGLGKRTDRAIAEELECSSHVVHYQRTKRGIPSFTPHGSITEREVAIFRNADDEPVIVLKLGKIGLGKERVRVTIGRTKIIVTPI